MSEIEITPEDIRAFFDRFVVAFASFDEWQVAELFATPAVACRKDGSLVALTTAEDVAAYYKAALDGYRSGGCTYCEWSDLQTMPMGAVSVAAAVIWRLRRADGSILVAWRQTYCLVKAPGGLKNFAAISHAV